MRTKKIKDLEKLISKAQQAYYNDQPIFSDAEYDKLVEELTQLDSQNPVLSKVGYSPDHNSALKKVAHIIPMGSQNKVTTLEEFEAWAEKTNANRFIIQEKIDGLSVELIYSDGLLQQAITRGDGSIGEDITHNVVRMKNVEQKLKGFTGSLRGEIVLFKNAFAKLTKTSSNYTNPRNAAAGIARRKTPQNADMLNILYFDIASNTTNWKTEKQKMEFISSLGLSMAIYIHGNLGKIKEVYKKYADSYREQLSYDIDGLVVKVNDLSIQQELGEINNRPKGQVAWKFPSVAEETTLETIEWEYGLTGRLTPVAVFEPVKIGGVLVGRASLHTWSNVSKLGLHMGCKILVARRGEVIPHVEEVIQSTPISERVEFSLPSKCKCCEADLQFEGEFLVCPNSSCQGRLEGDFKKWIKVLDLDFLGDAFIDKLFQNYTIKGLWNLYQLSVDQIEKLPGYARTSAERVHEQIHKHTEIPLSQFLGALNIPNAAVSTFQTLIDAGFDSLERLQNATIQELSTVHSVGEITAEQIRNGLQAKQRTIDKLLNHITLAVKLEGKFSGMSFCFTGELEISRPIAMRLVKEHGGIVKSSVVKGLTYLVQADPRSKTGKSQKAKQHNVNIISGVEFLRMVDFNLDTLRMLGQT